MAFSIEEIKRRRWLKLESTIAESQAETCNKIGSYLEEILTMDDEQIKNESND